MQLQGNETNKGAYTVLQDWLIKTLDTETMFTLEELKVQTIILPILPLVLLLIQRAILP